MSFSSNVREELIGTVPSAKHCREEELRVYLRNLTEIRETEEGAEITLAADSPLLLRKIFTLIRKTISINNNTNNTYHAAKVAVESEEKGKVSFTIRRNCEEDRPFFELFMRAAVEEGRIPERSCCRRAYLRAAFILFGSMTDPSKSYHLEMTVRSREQAEDIADILLVEGLEAHISERGRMQVVYLKDSEAIADFLGMTGAHGCLMDLENAMIYREIANSVNRRVNCETSNIQKTVEASERQIEDIKFLEEQGVLDTMPRALRETASLRLRYKDLSLTELGEKADPPVGKSGINHRLRKLSEQAELLRKHRGIQN